METGKGGGLKSEYAVRRRQCAGRPETEDRRPGHVLLMDLIRELGDVAERLASGNACLSATHKVC
jgi:hypothetical protein